MGAAKVLGGLLFVAIGVILLVIGIGPIPSLENVSVVSRGMAYLSLDFGTMMASWDFTPLFLATGYLEIALIIPYVGYHYCRAGVKSMRHTKAKKKYAISEAKIGLLIAGFIFVCVAVALVLSIFLQLLEPAFQFLADLIPAFSYPGLLPQILIPVVLTLLIIYFLYWIGSLIMKSGIKKEETII